MRAGARITGTIADGRCPAMKKMAATGSMPARPPAISRPQSSSGEGELVYGLTGGALEAVCATSAPRRWATRRGPRRDLEQLRRLCLFVQPLRHGSCNIRVSSNAAASALPEREPTARLSE